jgi:hypothetical protein
VVGLIKETPNPAAARSLVAGEQPDARVNEVLKKGESEIDANEGREHENDCGSAAAGRAETKKSDVGDETCDDETNVLAGKIAHGGVRGSNQKIDRQGEEENRCTTRQREPNR